MSPSPPSPPLRPAARNGLGILLRMGAMACMAGLFALVKVASERGVPVFETLFFRNAFAFIPIAIYIARTSGFGVLRTTRPGAHLTRALVGLTGMVGGFMAVSHLPLTEATALSFSAPLFMTALSVPLLKEQVGAHRWAAVAVGLAGVLIMIRPDPAHMASIGVIFALVGAVGSALAMVTIRQISLTEPGPRIVFYFTLAGMVAGLASLPFGWVMPDAETLALLVVMGFLGGVGQLLLTEAIRVAPVAVVAPFDYSQLIWASLIAFLVWGELPRGTTLIGAAIVAGSGVYILYRETRKSREAAKDGQPLVES
ncbi:DMT family transporter [Phenylobacterium sp.]|uniref:DMT family transporter n=1 Tax=Phenylobacterium sp. TaxID=1871053 RepID=UPI002FDA513E